MKVRATRLGFYGDCRRRVGDVFVISDEKNEKGIVKELGSWMLPVDDSVQVVKPSFSSKKGKRFQQEEEDIF